MTLFLEADCYTYIPDGNTAFIFPHKRLQMIC